MGDLFTNLRVHAGGARSLGDMSSNKETGGHNSPFPPPTQAHRHLQESVWCKYSPPNLLTAAPLARPWFQVSFHSRHLETLLPHVFPHHLHSSFCRLTPSNPARSHHLQVPFCNGPAGTGSPAPILSYEPALFTTTPFTGAHPKWCHKAGSVSRSERVQDHSKVIPALRRSEENHTLVRLQPQQWAGGGHLV